MSVLDDLLHLGWWGALGVASTVGFGFGLPTGSTHLWPLVARSAVARGEVEPALWETASPMTAWAIGSAVGELPPYLCAHRFVPHIEHTWMATTTRRLVERLGGWGVMLLAAWPSVVFDAAGVAAGVARMPAGTFLASTVAGKLLKTPVQAYAVGAGALQLWEGDDDVPEHLGLYAAALCVAAVVASELWNRRQPEKEKNSKKKKER